MKNKDLKIEYININELKPWENNAKQHPQEQVEQIKKSIELYGMADPIGIWKDNTVIEGHGRLMACKELRIEKVPVIRLDDLTDEERREYMLVHNQTTMNSGWDFEKLKEELKDLDFEGVDFGFDMDFGEEDKEITEDEVPETPPEPLAKIGDLWVLGNHFLICGDCTDVNVVDRLMDGVKADMVFIDPPYALVGNSTGLGSATDDMLKPFFLAIFQNICKFTHDLMHVYVCCDWKSCNAILTEAKKTQLTEKSLIVWDKESIGLGSPYMSQYELIWFFENHKQKTMQAGKNEYKNRRNIKGKSNVWKYKRVQDREHNAQKPVELVAEALNNSCFENEIVLDLFGGSGSTLIACEQLNRKCYMCELSEQYCTVILQRYINLKGSSEDVFLLQDGNKIPYAEIEKNQKC